MKVEDMSYKEIVKDEESLKKYLKELIVRDDLDIENKVFSAALAGRFFEKEKFFRENKEAIFNAIMGEK